MEWEKLLSDVETACDETKTIDRKVVLDTTDRLYDMIRSGEEVPTKYVPRLFHIFAKFFEKFGNHWIIISSTSFVLKHLYGVYPIDYFVEYSIIGWLLSYSGNAKREIRDAVGQSLGSFAKAYDMEIFKTNSLPSYIQTEKKTVEEVEGFMVALGYIGSHLDSVNKDILNLLIENTINTKFDTYSAYVRTQALRGLGRFIKKHSNLDKQVLDLIEERAFLKLGDENINVRKEAAKLSICLGYSAESLLIRMINTLETAKSWEIRHGVCFALHCLASATLLISELTQEYIATLFETLKKEVERVDKNINAYNANSVAGQAIIQLFVTMHSNVELSLSLMKLETGYYEMYVLPTLIYMFRSPIAQLLDGAVTGFYNLLTKCPNVVGKEKEQLMVLLFKNRFHASGPIQISSRVVWQYGKCDLTDLTPNLIDFLKQESLSNNFEVKESVFKAIDDVLASTKYDKISIEEMFACLANGSKDSGPNSDVPRSAAINSLGSLISYSSRCKVDFSSHLKELMELSSKLLIEGEETVVYATLNMLRSLAEVFPDVIVKNDSVMASLYCLSKDDALDNDNIKYLSSALTVSLTYHQPLLLISFISTPWSLVDDNEPEKKEACSRVYRELSATVTQDTQFSNDLIKRIIKDLSNGFFEEKDSNIIQSNLAVSLKCFLRSNYFMQGLVTLGKTFCTQVLYYILHVFANKLQDFDAESEDVPKLKTPHAFNFYNLGLFKTCIDIVTKIKHFVAPEVLNKFLDNLAQLLYQQDVKYKSHVTLLLVTLISEKLTSNGIIGLAKGYVTEYDVKGSMTTTPEAVSSCIGLLKSTTYTQVPTDKKIALFNHLISAVKSNVSKVEGLLDVLIQIGKSETDPIIKGRILQLIKLTDFDDQYLNVVSSFFFEKIAVASDDENFFFYDEAIYAGKLISEFSPFYINNVIIDSLKPWWNESRVENVNLTDEKIQQLTFASMVNGSLKGYESKLITRIHASEVVDQVWKWRMTLFLKECQDENLVQTWKDRAMAVIREKRRSVNYKTYVTAFLVVAQSCAHLKKIDIEFLQLLSEAFLDEELEEERLYLKIALKDLQTLSQTPVVPPKPRLLQKVDFNSTFSKNQ